MWKEDIEMTTYPVSNAEKNPMFLEKKGGLSGKLRTSLSAAGDREKYQSEKVMRRYRTVFLEN